MSYHIRRIDPFWNANPLILALAVGGAMLALFGYSKSNLIVAGVGAAAMGVGVLMATKPAVSAKPTAWDSWLLWDSSLRTFWEILTNCQPTTPIGAMEIRRNQKMNL